MGYRRLLVLPTAVMAAGALWCAFYLVRQSIPVSTLPSTEQSSKSQLKQPLHKSTPAEAPTIQKVGKILHFSYTPKTTAKIQKVEFFADKKFVGVAYGVPYMVSVPESTLGPGKHNITVTVYTEGSNPQVAGTTYSSSDKQTAKASTSGTSDTSGQTGTNSTTTTTTTTATPAVDAPTNVQAAFQNNAVVLTWTAPSGVNLSYQIWRDNSKLATTTDTTYTDKTVVAGNTYDYYIVAVVATDQSSDPSDTAAITVPTASTASTKLTQSTSTSASA